MMTRLVVEGVPVQCLNFVKCFCELVGDDPNEYWRRIVAAEMGVLANSITASETGTCEEDVRAHWELDEAIECLNSPRDKMSKKLDAEDQKKQ